MSSPIVDDGKCTLLLTVVSMSELQRIGDKADPMGDRSRLCYGRRESALLGVRFVLSRDVAHARVHDGPVAVALGGGAGRVLHYEVEGPRHLLRAVLSGRSLLAALGALSAYNHDPFELAYVFAIVELSKGIRRRTATSTRFTRAQMCKTSIGASMTCSTARSRR